MNERQQEQSVHASAAGDARALGAALRDAREARGEALSDAAHALKMSSRQIDAMEQGRFDLLPGPAFVRGFLRNYARYLEVDAEHLIAGLHQEVPVQRVELTPVTNAKGAIPDAYGEHKVLKPVSVIIFGMLAVLGLGWYFDWFKVADTPPVVARTDERVLRDEPMPPEVLADTVDTVVSDSRPAVAEPDQEVATAVGSASGPVVVLAPTLDSTSVAQADEAAARTYPAVDMGPGGAASVTESESLEPESGGLVFRLAGEAWIQVRDGDGVTLYTGIGAPGTTRIVQGKSPFAVVVGNAAKVMLEFDGAPVDLAPHTSSSGVARVTLK